MLKKFVFAIIIVLFAALLLPLAIIHLIGDEEKIVPQKTNETVEVFLADEGRTEEMPINQYLKCSVAAEMPASFEKEALKAQAVASRTYLYAHIEQTEKGNVAESHPDAAICTNSKHCQAYIGEEERRKSWGADADKNWDKISTAVEETNGEIMTYNGEIISAVYHSTSSGATEAAVDVWGSDVPYLQSVKSEGDAESPKYHSELTISADEFRRTADENIKGTDWSKGLFSDIMRSEAGGIISLNIGGVNIKGGEFRNIFSLRSANVEITEEDGNIKMSVKGFGHGVGMSQYGADYMASHGSGYAEILKTYYTGIEIEQR